MKNKIQPTIHIPESVSIAQADVTELSGGAKLYTIAAEGDVVRVSFVFRAGTSCQSVPFSASATANLLSEGTRNFTAHQIAEKLDFYGSYFDVSIDRDYAVITFCSLSKFFEQTMETAREILLYPTFTEDEIRTYCSKRKQRLNIERSKVSMKAREAFTAALFGADHPYGVTSPGEMYDKLTREDIVEFYEEHYAASNCFVVSSGTISTQVISAIDDIVKGLSDVSQPAKRVFPEPNSVPFSFVRHQGALQSAIRTGMLLFPRTHPDYIPMQVVATILGGYFGSRLVHNLREEHGYTYGIFAGMVNLDNAGYLAIATEVASEATQDAVVQIFHEIERMRTEIVGEEELQMVKNIMVGEVMRILDGPFGIADVTIENVQNQTDNDYLNNFVHIVRDITAEHVFETAKKYLLKENFTTVVVGDIDIEQSN